MPSKNRRTLKQAYQEAPASELESFVFGADSEPPVPPSHSPEPEQEFEREVVVPLSKIHRTFSFTPNGKPVRYHYDQDELAKWAESDLKPNGVRTALWVRPMSGKPGEYELVAGLRRFTACELAGITNVPVKVFDWDDDAAYAAAFDENDRRRDFSKLEEVDIVLNLLSNKLKLSQADVVSLLYKMDNQAKGKTTQSVLGNEQAEIIEAFFAARGQLTWRSFVSTRLPLLKKPPEILEAIRSSQLHYTKAVEISKLKDSKSRMLLLKKAISKELSLSEVKQQVKALANTAKSNSDLKARFKSVIREMDKVDAWSDADKSSKLKGLLEQIEQLLS